MHSSFSNARPAATAGAPPGFGEWREGDEDDDGNAVAPALINTTPTFSNSQRTTSRVFFSDKLACQSSFFQHAGS